MTLDKIEIIPYSDDLKEFIKILNYEWLEKYFRVEQSDIQSLSNPKEEIIDKGGFIFYAKLNDEIVGTVSLLKKTETVFELAKMGVIGKAQGHKIGTLLLENCLDFAKQKHIKIFNFIFKLAIGICPSSLPQIRFLGIDTGGRA